MGVLSARRNVSIPVGQYTHLAATYDAAYLKLYTNGVLARTSAYSAPLGDSFCAWGFGGLTSTCGFSGQYLPYGSQIDEVSLYNRALLAGEINAIYLAGAAGKCTTPQSCTCTPTNAVASWPGEGDASDMFNNYPGTLQNGVGFDQGIVARAFTLNPTNQQAVEMPSLSSAPHLPLLDRGLDQAPFPARGFAPPGLDSGPELRQPTRRHQRPPGPARRLRSGQQPHLISRVGEQRRHPARGMEPSGRSV
jgi:hypothetical protein